MSIFEIRIKIRVLFGISLCLLLLFAGCGTPAPRFLARDAGNAPPATTGVADLEGVASYYADEFHGRKTANGETYDMHDMTAAHKTLPFNTKVRVRNLQNDKSVVVRINDRGPFKDGRIIDVSLESAKKLGLIANGTAPVVLEIIEMPSTER